MPPSWLWPPPPPPAAPDRQSAASRGSRPVQGRWVVGAYCTQSHLRSRSRTTRYTTRGTETETQNEFEKSTFNRRAENLPFGVGHEGKDQILQYRLELRNQGSTPRRWGCLQNRGARTILWVLRKFRPNLSKSFFLAFFTPLLIVRLGQKQIRPVSSASENCSRS